MSDGLDQVRAMRSQAIEVPPPDRAPEDNGNGDGREHSGQKRLPDGCPIVPLGVNGKTCYYLDALGQLQELPWKEHSHNNIKGMFGSYSDLLEEYWPRYNKDGEVVGWKPEMAGQYLMQAASDLGVWSPFEKVRGAGAWRGRQGELILHCGDRVWVGPDPKAGNNQRGKWVKTGLYDGHVYPAAPPLRRMADAAQPGNGKVGNPGLQLLKILNTWKWRRAETDAHLLLGAIGAQMLGGALKVRPTVWLTGGFGTGKSTAQETVKAVHGPNGVVHVSDATAAGIWQNLKYASLPVELDEQEAEEDNRPRQAIIKLARQSATGGVVLRGGADHTGTSFTARSAFLFGSILIPPIKGQDRSRMMILNLGKLDQGQEAPRLDEAMLHDLGARLLRRLVDHWHRFDATLDAYRQRLMAAGHASRGADVFGTALACADLILYDQAPETADDAFAAWSEKLAADGLAELHGEVSDEQACWQHLLSATIDPYRSGGRRTVAEWIARACNKPGRGEAVLGADEVKEAGRVLATFGLKICGLAELAKLYKTSATGPWPGGLVPEPPYLAVGNSHPAVAEIYRNTHWAAASGTQGVWVQSLARLDGAPREGPVNPLWFSGDDRNAIKAGSHRVTLVPLFVASTASAGEGENDAPGAGASPPGGGEGSATGTDDAGGGDDEPLPF